MAVNRICLHVHVHSNLIVLADIHDAGTKKIGRTRAVLHRPVNVVLGAENHSINPQCTLKIKFTLVYEFVLDVNPSALVILTRLFVIFFVPTLGT